MLIPQEYLWLSFGALTGLLIYLSGIGAGVIVVPTMVVVFNESIVVAVGTASLFSLACKALAGFSHIRQGNLSKALLISFLPASLLACISTAAFISFFIPYFWPLARPRSDMYLKLLVILVGAFAVASLYSIEIKRCLMRFKLSSISLITGVLVGATGTGGGVLVVPALLAKDSESIHRIVGTSLIIGLALSCATAVFYGVAGSLNFHMALWMVCGSFIVIPFAKLVFAVLSGNVLKHIVATAAALSLLVFSSSVFNTC